MGKGPTDTTHRGQAQHLRALPQPTHMSSSLQGTSQDEARSAPFVCHRPSMDNNGEYSLLKAALGGDLVHIKDIIRSLGLRNGKGASTFSSHKDGVVLHCAACMGHLEVCKYLVEELGADPNKVGGVGPFEGMTPFMASAQSDDTSTVKYLLDHGGDPMKADGNGRTVLHHAVCSGSTRVTEFLLKEGIPVDNDCGHGTPLFQACLYEQEKSIKILLDYHAKPNTIFCRMESPLNAALVYQSLKCMDLLIKAGANVNVEGFLQSLLLFATEHGGYTNFIQLLLKAGANPNIPNDLGRLPIELAATRECREEVEILFPCTAPIANAGDPDWSVDGIICAAKLENAKPRMEGHLEARRAPMKTQADKAFKREEYAMASKLYSEALSEKREYLWAELEEFLSEWVKNPDCILPINIHRTDLYAHSSFEDLARFGDNGVAYFALKLTPRGEGFNRMMGERSNRIRWIQADSQEKEEKKTIIKKVFKYFDGSRYRSEYKMLELTLKEGPQDRALCKVSGFQEESGRKEARRIAYETIKHLKDELEVKEEKLKLASVKYKEQEETLESLKKELAVALEELKDADATCGKQREQLAEMEKIRKGQYNTIMALQQLWEKALRRASITEEHVLQKIEERTKSKEGEAVRKI